MKPLATIHAALLLSLALPAAAATPYQAAVDAAGTARAQYAILHALVGFRGGSNPSYNVYKAPNEALLNDAHIHVDEVTDPAAAKQLILKMDEIKIARNNGRKDASHRSVISEVEMVRRHGALIAQYADHIKLTSGTPAPGAADTKAERVALFNKQAQRLGKLLPPLTAMEDATDQAAFEKSLADFNDAAANFPGRHYKIERESGESFAHVFERARNIYSSEAMHLQGYADETGSPTKGLVADLESLKSRGAFFDGANGEKVPVVKPGSFDSKSNPNEHPLITPDSGKSALKTEVPNPAGATAKKGGEKPGLFGMFGSLLGGLFRTLSRVATALFKGAVGVVKAVLS